MKDNPFIRVRPVSFGRLNESVSPNGYRVLTEGHPYKFVTIAPVYAQGLIFQFALDDDFGSSSVQVGTLVPGAALPVCDAEGKGRALYVNILPGIESLFDEDSYAAKLIRFNCYYAAPVGCERDLLRPGSIVRTESFHDDLTATSSATILDASNFEFALGLPLSLKISLRGAMPSSDGELPAELKLVEYDDDDSPVSHARTWLFPGNKCEPAYITCPVSRNLFRGGTDSSRWKLEAHVPVGGGNKTDLSVLVEVIAGVLPLAMHYSPSHNVYLAGDAAADIPYGWSAFSCWGERDHSEIGYAIKNQHGAIAGVYAIKQYVPSAAGGPSSITQEGGALAAGASVESQVAKRANHYYCSFDWDALAAGPAMALMLFNV